MDLREARAGYLVEAEQRVPKGYKQTEVGVIPEDWEVQNLGSIARVIGGGAFKSQDAMLTGLRWLKIANVGVNEILWNDESFLPEQFAVTFSSFLLKEGDYVLALTRPILGGVLKIAKIRKEDAPTLLNQRVGKLECVDNNDLEFIYFLFQKESNVSAIQQSMAGTDPPNLSTRGLYSILCAFPKNKAEQKAIAEALSDADALIESLKQLIAKKRQIKQGTMQELLTGKKRLPGFSGEWEECRLIDCLLANPDYGINAPGVPSSGDLPVYLRITDIDDDGRFMANNRVAVNHPQALNYILKENEIVFARTGASVGKTYLYDPVDGSIVFAGFLIRARIDCSKISPAFFAAFTRAGLYWNWVRVISMRSGQPGINGNEYASLELNLPSLPEQTAIAAILTDMDAEITALEEKLAKTRAIKQGMMHNLLTRRIRLI